MSKIDECTDLLAIRVAAGATIRAAAADVGCSESTAYRASAKPEFRRRVAELRSDATQAAVGKLSDAASQAVDTMVELLDDEESSVRLQASKAILANLAPMAEFGELRERLDAIEGQNKFGVVS